MAGLDKRNRFFELTQGNSQNRPNADWLSAERQNSGKTAQLMVRLLYEFLEER